MIESVHGRPLTGVVAELQEIADLLTWLPLGSQSVRTLLPRVNAMISHRARSAARTRNKSERLAVRISREQHTLLREASRTQATTVTEFVLSAATRAAEHVLADRSQSVLAEPAWTAFLTALDRPPRELPLVRKLLATPSVLDEG